MRVLSDPNSSGIVKYPNDIIKKEGAIIFKTLMISWKEFDLNNIKTNSMNIPKGPLMQKDIPWRIDAETNFLLFFL